MEVSEAQQLKSAAAQHRRSKQPVEKLICTGKILKAIQRKRLTLAGKRKEVVFAAGAVWIMATDGRAIARRVCSYIGFGRRVFLLWQEELRAEWKSFRKAFLEPTGHEINPASEPHRNQSDDQSFWRR